jgi:hypothetical protein
MCFFQRYFWGHLCTRTRLIMHTLLKDHTVFLNLLEAKTVTKIFTDLHLILIKNSQNSKTLEPRDHHAHTEPSGLKENRVKPLFFSGFQAFLQFHTRKCQTIFYLKIGASYLSNFNTADVTSGTKVHFGTFVSIYTYIKIFNK